MNHQSQADEQALFYSSENQTLRSKFLIWMEETMLAEVPELLTPQKEQCDNSMAGLW